MKAKLFPAENLNLKLHHTGVACSNLDRESDVFEMLGYEREGDDFVDPLQGVRGRFLTKDGTRIELLENLSEKGTLTPWLKRGVKLYHLAYEVDSLSEAISFFLDQKKGKLVGEPLPAVAFGGREIVFLFLPNLLLIELISHY